MISGFQIKSSQDKGKKLLQVAHFAFYLWKELLLLEKEKRGNLNWMSAREMWNILEVAVMNSTRWWEIESQLEAVGKVSR